MDTFKLPSDVKHKFVPRKTADDNIGNKPSTDASTATPKAEEDIPSIIERKEPSLRPIAAAAANPYKEPLWSEAPSGQHEYSVEMLKNGTIVETVADLQSRAFWLIGKLPTNHIVMAHPTVSRHHAVLQFRPVVQPTDEPTSDGADNPKKPAIESGWYLYDLGSTHGSFVNKRKVPEKTYVRVRVGYMISFGASTRRLILQGPESDAEPESELSITEMKELRAKQRLADEEAQHVERERLAEVERQREANGISWGMQDDAEEESDLSVNPFAATNNEELFLDDPKKTLRGYFEREGFDLEYKVDEMSVGSFVCRIELPISDANGRPIVCEVSHKGKKKECVAQGALEACRMLDRHGVLRNSHHESRKRKVERSDSDGDDDFFDRTGAVERKRDEKENASVSKAFTYDELLQQEIDILEKLESIKARIGKLQEIERAMKERAAAEHDLDDFMKQLSNEKYDKTDIRRLHVEAKEVEYEHRKLQRMIRIARPVGLPALVTDSAEPAKPQSEKKKLALPLFGKRGKIKFVEIPATKCVVENVDELSEETENFEFQAKPSLEIEMEQIQSGSNVVLPIAESLNERDDRLPSPAIIDKKTEIQLKESTINEDSIISDVHPTTTESAESSDVQKENEPVNEETSNEIECNAHEESKKKRKRPRVRTDRGCARDNFEEPEETLANSEKYSTWVPPTNQSGDGSTSLNDKFGY